MNESEAAKVAERLQGTDVWDEAARQIAATFTMLRENVDSGLPDEDPQSSAVSAERVVELEREIAETKQTLWQVTAHRNAAIERANVLERQLMDARDAAAARTDQIEELRDELKCVEQSHQNLADMTDRRTAERNEARELLATAYVAREVPWSDVAAGMMTIARDGTPWMVADVVHEPRLEVLLSKAQGVFPKSPEPGETVRVLVPYVTPEQAEELVRNELGGVRA